MMPLSRRWFRDVLPRGWAIAAVAALPGIALAEVDYSSRKTPEQLFASDCAACHASPQGIGQKRDARSLTGFLREHYTTKTQWAAVLADYLVRVRALPPFQVVQSGAEQAAKGAPARDAQNSTTETLQAKVRSYMTAGVEAKPP